MKVTARKRYVINKSHIPFAHRVVQQYDDGSVKVFFGCEIREFASYDRFVRAASMERAKEMMREMFPNAIF